MRIGLIRVRNKDKKTDNYKCDVYIAKTFTLAIHFGIVHELLSWKISKHKKN